MKKQHREERAHLPSAERDGPSSVAHLDRAEQAVVHGGAPTVTPPRGVSSAGTAVRETAAAPAQGPRYRAIATLTISPLPGCPAKPKFET